MGRLTKLPSRGSVMPQRALGTTQTNTWGKGKGATERGYTYRWEQYRKNYLKRHPLCVHCEDMGKVTAAYVVDHIVPHKGNVELFWDCNNHQSLCKDCHDGWKQRLERSLGY